MKNEQKSTENVVLGLSYATEIIVVDDNFPVSSDALTDKICLTRPCM